MDGRANNQKKILIIDDNQGVLFVMRQALRLKEYDVRVANLFEGISVIKDMSPDLIFLDVSLPEKDGYQALKELKGNPDTKNIPVIMLAAHPNTHQGATKSGADDYLAKPFGLTRLWEMTAKYTTKS